jgi:sulfur transfer protein SufE
MNRRDKINCYLPRRLADELKRQARLEGLSFSSYARQLLTTALLDKPVTTLADLDHRMLFATLALEALLSTHSEKGLYDQVVKAWRAAREDGEGA